MFLVYSKLTRDGFKVVRVRPNTSDIPDQSPLPECEESDIDPSIIIPLHGAELVVPGRPQAAGVEDILTDLIDVVVAGGGRKTAKRKESEEVAATAAKQPRLDTCELEAAPVSPKYEVPCDEEGTGSSPEVVTIEDGANEEHGDLGENENTTDCSNGGNIYINPFHDSGESSDDEVENMSVVDIEEEDEVQVTECTSRVQQKNTFTEGSTEPEDNLRYQGELIQNQQNMNRLVTTAIQHQVAAAEMRAKAMEKELPNKFVEGRNSHLCKICNVVCNTPEMLKIHESGQKHKKKLLKSKASAEGVNSFSCDICGIDCTDATALVGHFKGKRHLKAMTNRAQMNTDARLPAASPDSDVMIVTDRASSPSMTMDNGEEDIEILTGDEKSREEIINDLPNCSKTDFLQLNKPFPYLLPTNTWTSSKSSRELNVDRLFTIQSCTRKTNLDAYDDPVDATDPVATREEIHIVEDDDEDEIILVKDNVGEKVKKKICTPLSRPFRGMYPSKEFVKPLASVGGVYNTIRNFGFHAKPPRATTQTKSYKKQGNVWRNFQQKQGKSKQRNKSSHPTQTSNNVENLAESIMGVGAYDPGEEVIPTEEIDFEDLAARAKKWIEESSKKTSQNVIGNKRSKEETDCDKADANAIYQADQARKWIEKGKKKNLNDIGRGVDELGIVIDDDTDYVDLGSSGEEDEDRPTSSSSCYSDDVSAHSELRHFKDGPLGSLWTFEDKIGPLICPEMASSMREIYNRLRMEPPEIAFPSAGDGGDSLDACYDVFLAENYRKQTISPPDYRVIIQSFNSALPSPQVLCDLDRKYPDNVPFLFAIVSGGTVSFFNVDRVDLPSYFKKI